jgi:hypothetical protein
VQDDSGPLTRWQTRDRSMHPGSKFGRFGQIIRSRCCVHRFREAPATEHCFPRPGLAPLALLPAAADVQSDPNQPRTEALRLAEAIEAEQRLQDGFLGGVFCQTIVPKRPATHGEKERLMARKERSEGGSIAITRDLDECGVLFVSIHGPGAPLSSRIDSRDPGPDGYPSP